MFVFRPQLQRMLSTNLASIRQMMESGQLPKAVKINGRMAWSQSQLEDALLHRSELAELPIVQGISDQIGDDIAETLLADFRSFALDDAKLTT